MNVVITGHRLYKLEAYDTQWIELAIYTELLELKKLNGFIQGFSGMASGVDLWFCESLELLKCPWVACPPFEEQGQLMSEKEAIRRQYFIDNASKVMKIRNSAMLRRADLGLVCWDGNKGGTHNVVQQMIESKMPFTWINPVAQKIWKCH